MYTKSLIFAVYAVCVMSLFNGVYGTSLNISGVVRDSLSHDSLPLVTVTIEEFNKSFTTTRSGFYIALDPASYIFVLEADAYETLRKKVSVVSEGQEILFEMVQLSDRAELGKQSDSLFLFLQGFQYAITHKRLKDAYAYMIACKRFDATSVQLDSMMIIYNNLRTFWVDSVFIYAQSLEDSQKLSDAYYYYKKIIAVDSLHEGAQKRLVETEKLLTAHLEGKTNISSAPSQTTAPSMSPEQIQALFNQAVTKFLEEDYNGALQLLQTVLKHNPNHEGAKNYLSRTQARLQIK